MKKYPLVSIVIPTYNSERNLPIVLRAIKKQSYPKSAIETLVVDGGSEDDTLKVARKFGCRVVINNKTLQVFGKQLGTLKSKGKFIVHLDSDEEMLSKRSLEGKVEIFLRNKKVKAVIPTGLLTPRNTCSVNHIINEFGDPFSFYMFRASIHADFFIPYLKKVSKVVCEDDNGLILDFSKTKNLPPIELSAIGIMIDREWVVKILSNLEKNPALISQAFYFLVQQSALLGVTKNDSVLHYSATGWRKYLKKIRSRIVNNVYKTEMGKSAFSGRDEYYSLGFRIKRYLFIPYSFSIILPLIDGLYLVINRKNLVFLSLPFLCVYISFLTLYYYTLKFIGVTPKIKGYGF